MRSTSFHAAGSSAEGPATHLLVVGGPPKKFRPGPTGFAEMFGLGPRWGTTGWRNEELDSNPWFFQRIHGSAPAQGVGRGPELDINFEENPFE